jgi:hypothetical protein
VIKHRIVVATVASFSTAVLGAQAPQPPQTPDRLPAAAAEQPSTTLVGCLYREDQVPGRQQTSPNGLASSRTTSWPMH